MLFNSVFFILIFLPLFLLLWHGLKNVSHRLVILTLMSFFFYGYWDYRFVSLMFVSIVIDYWCGEKIAWNLSNNNKSRAKLWMRVSVFSNLTILGFFKYFNFFIDSLFAILPEDGIIDKPMLEIVLPVGISFYTFQSMSYSIDLYKGNAKKIKSFLHFSAYVSMFPQLIAGPIVRYSDISEQLNSIKTRTNYEKIMEGLKIFAIGLVRKLFIADFFAAYSDMFFAGAYDFQFIGAWIGVICYALQIYFDFSAYSEMAIGLGKMFGFEFPINFNSPYKAKSFSDFWLRWHITLSRFLRDYLYIPLGGNKLGTQRTYVNLMLTMLIGGLWHGAGWLFVIWGGLHGLYLAVERMISRERLSKLWWYKYVVFMLVCIAWIFFRADNLDFAMKTLRSCLFLEGIESFQGSYEIAGFAVPDFLRTYGGLKLMLALAGVFVLVRFVPNSSKLKLRFNIWTAVATAIVLYLCLLYVDRPSPFIYFQF